MHKPLRALQILDHTRGRGERAERGISFSQNADMIEGLSLNTANNLESLIQTFILSEISEDGVATVQISRLVPWSESPTESALSVLPDLASIPDIHFVKGSGLR